MVSNSTKEVHCLDPMKATSNGVFQGDSPFHYALPLLILQMCLVLVVTRVLAKLFKPLRQPRVIAEIVGGVLLGPSALGRNKTYLQAVFPARSLTVLDTVANLGLLFYLFLVGLELDLKSLKKTGKKALSIAVAGISLPFALGVGVSFILRKTISQGANAGPFIVFMGVAMSITAFPVLARILTELKLLTTDVGKTAMSAAAVNDMAAWILLALAVALSGSGHSPLVSVWVFLCGFGFITLCAFIVPPLFKWMAQTCPEGEPVDEVYVCATLGVVLAAGFITDAIGIHALFGGFVVGVLIPKEGAFAEALVEKVEDLVTGLFLPLYFVSSGLKTNVASIHGAKSWVLLVLVVFTACLGKIFGTVAVSIACEIPFVDALTLGILMNTKGLVELIVLNIGKDRGVLNDQTFAVLVLMALFTTFITTPLVVAIYKPKKLLMKSEYKNRKIQQQDSSTSSFSMFLAFHGTKDLPSMVNMVEASRGTRNQALSVHAMHLMELSERPSSILMVHKARNNGFFFWKKYRNIGSNHVMEFESFRQLSKVVIKPTIVVSSVSSMHEDICNEAESKRASIIILPFHKQLSLDGQFETTRPRFHQVNRKVLEHAPCSVGILIDRGLGGNSHISASNVDLNVTVLFFGGHDDQEALAYGLRIAEHPGVSLTVVHFFTQTTTSDIDDIMELKRKIVLKEINVKYDERVVQNPSETIGVIREYNRCCNLFLVGRMSEGEVVDSLKQKSDCPEIGPVGNLLISSDFVTKASVLVIKQYRSQMLLPSLASLMETETNNHQECVATKV